ncbi:MAG: O-antigen ligase family protein [Ruminococcaceae bacterium]|nr:O-antigen ligase family protein [Oscillospiraceae bacterium]
MGFLGFLKTERKTQENNFIRNKYANIAHILIFLCAFSCFTYYNLARALIYATALIFIILPGTRDKVFIHKGSLIIDVFILITFIVALVNKNYLGALCALSFFAMTVVAFVSRGIATKRFYEKLLDVIILGGCTATLIGIVEKLINFNIPSYRCTGFYPNPNFFGLGATLTILICAYKAVNKTKRVYLYYLAAIFNAVGIALCGSMSLWLVAALGIVILLTISHEYKLLAVFALICVTVLVIIVLVPQFLPRIDEMGATTDNRVLIWNFAIKHIKEKPVFGHGFFGYKHLYDIFSQPDPTIYKASLCHNIIIDSLLCHGILGTVLIIAFTVRYIGDLFYCHTRLKNQKEKYTIIKFIVAVLASIFCYGMIDTTMIWVQTGMIILFIASGIGVEERKIKHLRK